MLEIIIIHNTGRGQDCDSHNLSLGLQIDNPDSLGGMLFPDVTIDL